MAGSISGGNMGVEIVGLNQFYRALRALEPAFPAELKKANYKVSMTIVRAAKEVARGIPGRGGGRSVQARASGSLRATRTATGAAILGGGGRSPEFYGAEFGSLRYKQFDSWRGNQWKTTWEGGPGYFLHPGIRAAGPQAIREYMDFIDELTLRAFPE